MKFSLSWLKEHLDTSADIQGVADALNRIGLEVEGIENPAEKLKGFTVAKVLTADRHPQADKLQVLTVDAGQGPLQVVCGAPNARAGLVGVFGVEGAVVPANGMVLKKAAIRGVESNGMMCSTRELELGDDHDGIIELPADAPIGVNFADYARLDDPIIDVEGMRAYIQADSLSFISIDGLYKAVGEAKRHELRPQYCDACFTGHYPTKLTDQDEVDTVNQLSLLAERVV